MGRIGERSQSRLSSEVMLKGLGIQIFILEKSLAMVCTKLEGLYPKGRKISEEADGIVQLRNHEAFS